MQEEVEQRSLTLAVNTTKMSGRIMKEAISKYLAHRKNAKDGVHYRGKQTVKQLVGQNQGVSNVELTDSDAKGFERIARHYGVDYAVKKVKGENPRYLIFFKSRDADALQAALSEYANKKVKTQERPSILKQLKDVTATLTPKREKHKEREACR